MIEDILKAQLQCQERSADALESIAAALGVIAKKMEIAGSYIVETATPEKKPATGSRRQVKNVEREEPVEQPIADETPVEVEEVTELDPLEEPETPVAEEFTADDVKKALAAYREINGTPAMMKILSDHDATGMGSLKPEHYASVMKQAG
jgi:folate-dependent tRNA-U54 methylase TrmFO/GidA